MLRNMTLDRPAERITRYEYLPRDIEMCCTAILEKEIELQRKLEVLKREIQVQYDYSTSGCFRSVDRYNQKVIDTVQLGTFLRTHGHYTNEMELIAIIRRIDTNSDASIDYSELADFLKPLFPSPAPPSRSFMTTPIGRPLSPDPYSSPLRASFVRSSGPGAFVSPAELARSIPVFRYSPEKPNLRPVNEDELVHALKE